MSNIKVIAEREDLVAVANAIRNKTGETTGITLNDMPTAIGDIATEPTLQSKTVSPTTSSQIVKPDSGYDGLSQVTVNAMSTATQATPSISVNSNGLITASATQTAGYVTAGTKTATKQLTTQAAKTVTPSASSQTAVESGKYTTGAVMVAGDSNLVAGNIKSGVSIFGVNGSYEGSGSGSGGESNAFETATVYLDRFVNASFAIFENNQIIARSGTFTDMENVIVGSLFYVRKDYSEGFIINGGTFIEYSDSYSIISVDDTQVWIDLDNTEDPF